MMKKKKSTLNRLRGSVVDYKGPFEPVEEDSWEALNPPNRNVYEKIKTAKHNKRPHRGRNNHSD